MCFVCTCMCRFAFLYMCVLSMWAMCANVYMCICIQVSVWVYPHMWICIHVDLVCMPVCLCTRVHVCMVVDMCAFVWMCACGCVYMCAHTRVYLCMLKYKQCIFWGSALNIFPDQQAPMGSLCCLEGLELGVLTFITSKRSPK